MVTFAAFVKFAEQMCAQYATWLSYPARFKIGQACFPSMCIGWSLVSTHMCLCAWACHYTIFGLNQGQKRVSSADYIPPRYHHCSQPAWLLGLASGSASKPGQADLSRPLSLMGASRTAR